MAHGLWKKTEIAGKTLRVTDVNVAAWISASSVDTDQYTTTSEETTESLEGSQTESETWL